MVRGRRPPRDSPPLPVPPLPAPHPPCGRLVPALLPPFPLAGFLVLEGFSSPEEVAQLKARGEELVRVSRGLPCGEAAALAPAPECSW